jgi:hypothetical protein
VTRDQGRHGVGDASWKIKSFRYVAKEFCANLSVAVKCHLPALVDSPGRRLADVVQQGTPAHDAVGRGLRDDLLDVGPDVFVFAPALLRERHGRDQLGQRRGQHAPAQQQLEGLVGVGRQERRLDRLAQLSAGSVLAHRLS